LIARIAHFCFWGYVLMLLGIGASGILIASWELKNVFSLPLDSLPAEVQATFLNQYRFMKAVELSFGIFCWVWRHSIFQPGLFNRVFLSGVFLGVAARLLSWLIDGQPQLVFLIFTALELLTGVLCFWIVTRRSDLERTI
jgi:hypothetical protein